MRVALPLFTSLRWGSKCAIPRVFLAAIWGLAERLYLKNPRSRLSASPSR
jgi:hypothetical protein